MFTGVSIITTTFPDEAQALETARALVEARLAACVHVSPVKSVYRWEGALHEEAEYLLSVKTAAARVPEAAALIRNRHPYDVPELLVAPVAEGDAGYLKWVLGEVMP
jgi:periplasmic divalent cation tolerance protein